MNECGCGCRCVFEWMGVACGWVYECVGVFVSGHRLGVRVGVGGCEWIKGVYVDVGTKVWWWVCS